MLEYIINNWLELLGTLVGVVYLYLEYKASIHLWIASVVMPAIYLFIYYDVGLYADFGINVYYLLIALYGYTCWKFGGVKEKGKLKAENDTMIVSTDSKNGSIKESDKAIQEKSERELPITSMPISCIWSSVLLFVILFFVIAQLLIHATDSTVPWLDSFTTSLSIIGMWMLARKYVEQWWVWILVDIVSAGLYIYKELYMTATLYTLYAVIALFGYRKWKTMMKK